MSIHPHISSPRPVRPRPAPAYRAYDAIAAVLVIMAIGVLTFGSIRHRPTEVVAPTTIGQASWPIMIVPILDPVAETE